MRFQSPLVLGIETSCDDTACAVVDGAGRVLTSAVSSQLAAHRPYGGVVPEIASREHLKNWPEVSRIALAEAGITLDNIELVAATRGPGLIGCLLVGLSIGRAIARGLGRPFHGVHHLEGHLYSPFLATDQGAAAPLPAHFTGLIVSGGHTSLLAVDSGRVRSLAETRDDAMGEVFDKVGKRLGLAYPQGPVVDRLAERGDAARAPLHFKPRGEQEALFFSYSGLKSQALRAIERLEREGIGLSAAAVVAEEVPPQVLDLLAGFRAAAVRQILSRLTRHHSAQPIDCLAVSGGVAANRLLRRELKRWAQEHGVDLRLVPLGYAGDNAAMIAFAALVRHRSGIVDDPHEAARVASRLPFEPASAQ